MHMRVLFYNDMTKVRIIWVNVLLSCGQPCTVWSLQAARVACHGETRGTITPDGQELHDNGEASTMG